MVQEDTLEEFKDGGHLECVNFTIFKLAILNRIEYFFVFQSKTLVGIR